MKVLLLAFSSLLVLSCGRSGNDNIAAKSDPSRKTSSTSPDSAGSTQIGESSSLGLLDNAGFANYTDLRGQKTNAAKAWGSVRHLADTRLPNCRGVYGYEEAGDGRARLYFYTARHCLEKRDPFGRRTGVFHDSEFSARAFDPNTNLTSNEAYARFLPVHPVISGKREIFRFSLTFSKGVADAVRFYQGDIPLAAAQASFLPVCFNVDESKAGYQVIKKRPGGATELVWANTAYVPEHIPDGIASILTSVSPQPFRRIQGIRFRPGDSGAAVFMFKIGASGISEVASYNCLYGILTREYWVQKSTCTGTSCSFNGEGIFERLRHSNTPNGIWETL
ncbi:MAG: hypothetical protein RI953_1980 [Pseudomonadota bacterium]